MNLTKRILTDEEVRQIRAEYKVVKGKAVNVIELAKRYGVSQLTIREIAKGLKYGEVDA
jgi:transposase